jgi:3D-(3,5/4)-trihydroxycyclohexane-1,2-dione acylhydrolase (decyclizing)
METIRLTMAQALVKFLQAQYVMMEDDAGQQNQVPLFGGVFAIFGHGNVAGLGEALSQVKNELPTYRGHNEQSMAFSAVAYAKQHRRQRAMAVTTSIGPGATNLVTAAALAHANRLPVLFLPGDTFSSRRPDPVLQQIEDFGDPGVTVNDTFKPVSRYFDRLHRPEQLITSAVQAMRVMTDPVACGPVTLALPQDVQTESYDYPVSFFRQRVWSRSLAHPAPCALNEAMYLVRAAKKPLIVAGGGVHYAQACAQLSDFAAITGIPVAETQAGKGALPWDHPQAIGSMGVTGSSAANHAADQADLIIAVGTRLQDFTTGSRTLFNKPLLSINVAAFDAFKHDARALVADAKVALNALSASVREANYQASPEWMAWLQAERETWLADVTQATAWSAENAAALPTDAQIIRQVDAWATEKTTVVCAAGGLPGELHKLWRAKNDLAYHVEYGYSCMGYEIAGGLGAKMAHPEREIVVMVGDGSYLMLNSEIATSVMLGYKIIIVVVDNRGFGCINRLQQGCGNEPFNNLWADCLTGPDGVPDIDFAAHAQALGAISYRVPDLTQLPQALSQARENSRTTVVCLEADAGPSTQAGGTWWDVAIPEVSNKDGVKQARISYEKKQKEQPY